jgi:extracellular factor (EF) 3-hydroxypalmitic acid methyl ester biosynthesis protein
MRKHCARDAVYCAGLFDYLSDQGCTSVMTRLAAQTRAGNMHLVTNLHLSNPEQFCMEHVLECYPIYRDEAKMKAMLPQHCSRPIRNTDAPGVNVFAKVSIREPGP